MYHLFNTANDNVIKSGDFMKGVNIVLEKALILDKAKAYDILSLFTNLGGIKILQPHEYLQKI